VNGGRSYAMNKEDLAGRITGNAYPCRIHEDLIQIA
jgi:hypothetical protein